MTIVTLSPKFQVVIPKIIREKLKLSPGQKLLKKIVTLFSTGLFLLLICPQFTFAEKATNFQIQVMKEEYDVMATMRHKLRELLERQKMEETLMKGDDVYKDFQQLDQWLQQLKKDNSDKTLNNILKILEDFEKHLQEILENQENLSQILPSPMQPDLQATPIPLSSLMDKVRQLLKEGKIREAEELLSQMLMAFDQRQQQLRRSVSQYYESKFEELQRQLQQMVRQAYQSLKLERSINSELRQNRHRSQLPESTLDKISRQQHQVTNQIEQMLRMSDNMPQSPLLPLDQLQTLLEKSRQSSENSENQIDTGKPSPSLNAVQMTQAYLERLQQTLASLQRQAQQMSQPRQLSQKQGNSKNYWGEKGIRPLKFGYDFKANPQYREEIQRFNQEQRPHITPRQNQYLQEVIK